MKARQTIGLGLAVLVAGPLLALGPAADAGAAVPAVAAARAGAAPDSACGVDLGTLDRPPLALLLQGVRHVHRAGGGWSSARLALRNRLSRPCAGVRPVLVFGVRGRSPRHGDVRLQWRRGPRGGWHPVRLLAEAGVLAGQVGPDAGLTVAGRGRASVPLRLRIGRGAAPGQWLTMAVGFEPVLLQGQQVPLPVGVSEPSLFRVVRAARGGRGGRGDQGGQGGLGRRPWAGAPEQLAATGDDVSAAAGAAALLLTGGAGLVLLRRAR